jgi:hypothetical protein
LKRYTAWPSVRYTFSYNSHPSVEHRLGTAFLSSTLNIISIGNSQPNKCATMK